VLSDAGGLIRSAAQLAPCDRLTTRLADGSFTSRVETTASRVGAAAPDAAPRH